MDGFTMHGTRLTYQRGCRCLPCRAANAIYFRGYRERSDSPALLVSARDAAAHLAGLAELGVGYRQAAQLSGLSVAEIRTVRNGRRTVIRPETEAAILAVRPVLAHGQKVQAWPTWRLIQSLGREGYTLGSLARFMGLQSEQLQLDHGRVTVRNALVVRKLHASLTAEGPEVTA